MATLKDIATKAGVSTATASRALRKIGYVSEETHARVENASNELKYIVDNNARQLRKGTSNLIGIIVSDIRNPFYHYVLSGFEVSIKNKNHMMLVSYSIEDAETERKSLKTLISAKVSVIVFTPVCNTNRDMVEIAFENNIKVIQLYRQVYKDIDAIVMDDELGAYYATKNLIENGCRSPMLIDVAHAQINEMEIFPRRSDGYLKALFEAGNDIKPLILKHPLTGLAEEELMSFLIKNKPDGVICGASRFGLEFLTLKKNTLLFNDVKLIIFDDIDWVGYMNITAISQSVEQAVDSLVRLIFDREEDGPILEKIAPRLIVR